MENINDKMVCMKCSECGMAFGKPKQLRKHMKTHGEGEYKCDECGKAYLTENSLQGHINSEHTGEKNIQCTECDKTFKWPRQLNEHMRTHLRCSECDRAFFTRDQLQQHIESHANRKPFECKECDIVFLTRDQWVEHRKQHSKEFKGKVYESQVYQHKCNECPRTFPNTKYLKQHVMKKHTGEKPHQCNECDKAFLLKAQLTEHERTHTGEKPFQCTLCGQSYAKKAKFKHHQKANKKCRLAAHNLKKQGLPLPLEYKENVLEGSQSDEKVEDISTPTFSAY